MPDYIGLYYPNSTLPSDSWVKLAALYWDKLGRIVPSDYQFHDSDTVHRLEEELGFIENFRPSLDEKEAIARLFGRVLLRYREQLIDHYRVLPHSSDLVYIYENSKVTGRFSSELQYAGLAVARSEFSWTDVGARIGLHPKLAFVYMEALAEEMALKRGLRPVTDNMRDHVVTGGYTLERLTQALLGTEDQQLSLVDSSPTENEIARQMATIALQSVLPKDIANVPTEKIIQLRKKHRTELTAFQVCIHEFTTKLDTVQQINDPTALKAHLEVTYERDIKPQLDDLRKCMKSLAIETVMGVFNVKVVFPPLLASTGAALHLASFSPVIAGIGAVACSIFPVFQSKRAEASEKIHKLPAAYLLYVEEGLTPTNVVSQVARTTRHLLFAV